MSTLATEALERAKVYLESWKSYPAKTLGPRSTAFVRQLILDLGGLWPEGYLGELGEEATIAAHGLLGALVRYARP